MEIMICGLLGFTAFCLGILFGEAAERKTWVRAARGNKYRSVPEGCFKTEEVVRENDRDPANKAGV